MLYFYNMNIELSEEEKIKILNSDDLFTVMQGILLREQKIDQDREHFWTISLNNANQLLAVELIGLGTVNSVAVKPMEVFSLPLQKRAVKLMLVHNHPSGQLKPSEEDLDITDNLIQVGLILNVPVLDHLIISTESYYSFKDSGVLDKLVLSTKYVPHYRIKELAVEKAKRSHEKARSIEIAEALKDQGVDIEKIEIATGLTKSEIKDL